MVAKWNEGIWLPVGYISSVMCRDHDWQPVQSAHVTRDCPGPGPMCWHSVLIHNFSRDFSEHFGIERFYVNQIWMEISINFLQN